MARSASRHGSIPSYNFVPSLSIPGRRQSALESLGLRKKADIEIVLEGAQDFVHSYSTYDEIKGTVNLKFDKDTTIDDLSVTFEGVSLTYVEKVATTAPTTGRTTGRHTFLKLLQPIEPEALPENRLAKAGQSYHIPFTFVVPDRLLPQICTHPAENEDVRHAHLRLPPSLGDPTLAGDGQSLMDDLAPDMSRVTYSIRARVAKRNPSGRQVEIGDKSVKIRIVPAREELPPSHVEDDSVDFVLRKEKNVKKGLFKIGKIGRLTAETTQPQSLHLPHPAQRSTDPVTTMTTVKLRFDPQTPEDQPPQLGSIVAKLRVFTFFGAAPYRTLPKVSAQDNWSTLHGLYPEYVELSSRCLSTVAWICHDPESPEAKSSNLARRPSTFSTASSISIPEPSASYVPGSHFWTASVLVPISLPTNTKKTFLPSFNSCIISRSYALDLNISCHAPGTKLASSSILLKSPIQISSEGGTPPAPIDESEAQIASEIERQFFNYETEQLAQNSRTGETGAAQSVLPPSPEYSERPDYAALGQMVRHGSYAAPAAPPEYHSGGGGRQGRSGNARTQSVSVRA